ncbi:MAG: protein kinase [Planctomycetes bacterium]|nr:protein kinase [Planctomycetota bacterium]
MGPSRSGEAPDDAARSALRAYADRAQAGKAESIGEFIASNGFLEEVLKSVLARIGSEEDLAAALLASPEAGERPRFRILRPLGAGGMGTVHLAWDEVLGRNVALKEVRPELLASAEARARFALEARAASMLSHPNLCPVFDVGERDGVPFIVMPFVEGETLAARIARWQSERRNPSRTGHPSSIEARGLNEVMDLVETLARAMHHAHEVGLVHRDLKPGNVIVRDDGSPMVLDFGLAHVDAEVALTRTGLQPGTREYMAPEQIAPRGRSIDRRTDVWALGVILYECLALERPFRGDDDLSLAQAVLAARPMRLRALGCRVPRDLEVVIETALAPEPERRYRTALDLAEDLRRVRRHEPVRARRAGLGVRVLRWCRREPWIAATLGIVAVALTVVAALLSLAEERLDRFQLLQHLERLRTATIEATALFPAAPSRIHDLVAWLEGPGAEAAAFAERLPREIERVAARAQDDGAAAYLHRLLGEHQKAFAEFIAPEGLLARVRNRLERARDLERISLVEHAAAWREAVEIAGRAGIALSPQLGLVPLGVDPRSGFLEFHDLASARDWRSSPTRDPATGRLGLTDDSGIVLVLLPRRSAMLGAQARSADEPCYDAAADPKGRPRSVEIGPLFVSKFELTQSQVRALEGIDRSREYAGKEKFGIRVTLRHPAEFLSAQTARELLARCGMRLPTRDEWEFACRAGGETPWSTGDDEASLQGHANLLDRTAAARWPLWWFKDGKPREGQPVLDDGWVDHAPVGSFLTNAFGLHDLHGNVYEMAEANPGPGDEIGLRGGNFSNSPTTAKCWYDIPFPSGTPAPELGVRPVRALHR